MGDIVQTLTNTGNVPETVTYTITPTSMVDLVFGNANDCPGAPITVDVLVGIEPEMDAEIGGMSIADPNGPLELCEGDINDGTGDQSTMDVQFDLTSMTNSGGGPGSMPDPWINEFHYDNVSGDVGRVY